MTFTRAPSASVDDPLFVMEMRTPLLALWVRPSSVRGLVELTPRHIPKALDRFRLDDANAERMFLRIPNRLQVPAKPIL
jgi:hypothetical protein